VLIICKHFGWKQIAVVVDNGRTNQDFASAFTDTEMRKRLRLNDISLPQSFWFIQIFLYRTDAQEIKITLAHTILDTEFDDHYMDLLMVQIKKKARGSVWVEREGGGEGEKGWEVEGCENTQSTLFSCGHVTRFGHLQPIVGGVTTSGGACRSTHRYGMNMCKS
jgi:hypothetical protein